MPRSRKPSPTPRRSTPTAAAVPSLSRLLHQHTTLPPPPSALSSIATAAVVGRGTVRYCVTLPWPHRALSPNARVHWAVRARVVREARKVAWVRTREALSGRDVTGRHPLLHRGQEEPQPPRELPVLLILYPPARRRRRRDVDNAVAACKAYIDGMAEACGINDTCIRPQVQWVEDGAGIADGAVCVEWAG